MSKYTRCLNCGSKEPYEIVDCSDNIGRLRIWVKECPVCGRRIKQVKDCFDGFVESKEVIKEGIDPFEINA